MPKMSQKAIEAIQENVKNRVEFYHRAITAAHGNEHDTGRMDDFWKESFRSDMKDATEAGETAYVVASYGTPLIWWTPSYGWTYANQVYSVTTTEHQGIVEAGAEQK